MASPEANAALWMLTLVGRLAVMDRGDSATDGGVGGGDGGGDGGAGGCNGGGGIGDGRRREQLAPLMECLQPLSRYDVHANTSTPANMSGWHWTDERRGKPGWVTYSVGKMITFKLRFGRHPSLNLGYLRSYEGLGRIELSLNGRQHVIDPLWKQRISTTHVEFLQAGANEWSDDSIGIKGFNVKGYSTLPLTITFLGPTGKFKLVSVTSC